MKTGNLSFSRRRHRILVLVAAVLFVAAPTAVCFAQKAPQPSGMDKIKKIPRFDTISDADFLAHSKLYEETKVSDKYATYEIRIPEGWTKSGEAQEKKDEEMDSQRRRKKTASSSSVLGMVATYYGPPRLDIVSKVDVQVMDLGYGMAIDNWFLNYTFDNGYALQGMEQVSDTRVEGLFVYVKEGYSFIVRIAAEVSGSRVIVASYYLPEIYWDKEKDLQEKVVGSFKLLNPEKRKVEAISTYKYLNFLKFDYPASWRLLSPDVYSDEGMDARIINARPDQTLDGEINLHIYSTDMDISLPDELETLRDELTERGLNVEGLLETVTGYNFPPHIVFSRVEAYQAKDPSGRIQDHEYWIAIMADDKFYYIATMLTLGRESDFYTWARNAGAFETVVTSLRPVKAPRIDPTTGEVILDNDLMPMGQESEGNPQEE